MVFPFFSFFLALYHIHVAVTHTSFLIAYNVGLYDSARLLQLHTIVRLRFFLRFLIEMPTVNRCDDTYTAFCSIEYRLW